MKICKKTFFSDKFKSKKYYFQNIHYQKNTSSICLSQSMYTAYTLTYQYPFYEQRPSWKSDHHHYVFMLDT